MTIKPMVVKKRCPICGSLLVKQYVPELECDCWVCTSCGYTEPIIV